MGYTTEFTGSINVEPPLNEHEVGYLRRFARSRRMERTLGPYYCGTGFAGQDMEPDVTDWNRPCPDQPGTWCHWEPSADGREIAWNGVEKFYVSPKWMAYLIVTFLSPGARLAGERRSPTPGWYYAPEFEYFTFDHVLNGVIDARGEEEGDVWQIVVTDGVVTYRAGGGESRPITDTAPRPRADVSEIRIQVRLAGGPDDGEVRAVPVAAFVNGVHGTDGAVYRWNQGMDRVEGYQVFEYQQL